MEQLQNVCRNWVEESLKAGNLQRNSAWSESLAVGRSEFVENIKKALGVKAFHRNIKEKEGLLVLKEPSLSYTGH